MITFIVFAIGFIFHSPDFCKVARDEQVSSMVGWRLSIVDDSNFQNLLYWLANIKKAEVDP